MSAAGAEIDAVYACPHLPGRRRSRKFPFPQTGAGHADAGCRDLRLDLSRPYHGRQCIGSGGGQGSGTFQLLVPKGYGARDKDAAAALANASFEVIRR